MPYASRLYVPFVNLRKSDAIQFGAKTFYKMSVELLQSLLKFHN
jgi:hypothetical protein